MNCNVSPYTKTAKVFLNKSLSASHNFFTILTLWKVIEAREGIAKPSLLPSSNWMQTYGWRHREYKVHMQNGKSISIFCVDCFLKVK